MFDVVIAQAYTDHKLIVQEKRNMKNSDTLVKLGDMVKVIPGATNTTYAKEASDTSTEFGLLIGSAVTAEGTVNLAALEPVWVEPGKDISRYLLQEGDVVLLARGSAIRAALVSTEVAAAKVIASANFLIIRTDARRIKPTVLLAYLNSPQGSAALIAQSSGAVIQSVSASSLAELNIPLPDMLAQNEIDELYQASTEAYRATLALAEQQKVLANARIANLMWS